MYLYAYTGSPKSSGTSPEFPGFTNSVEMKVIPTVTFIEESNDDLTHLTSNLFVMVIFLTKILTFDNGNRKSGKFCVQTSV